MQDLEIFHILDPVKCGAWELERLPDLEEASDVFEGLNRLFGTKLWVCLPVT